MILTALLALAAQDPLAVRPDSVRPRHDALHYDVALQLPDRSSTIAAVVTIQWRLTSAEPIRIDLDTVFTIQGVSLDGAKADWRREGLQLYFPHAGAVGDTAILAISYSGAPTDGLVIRDGANGRTWFADNWPDRARKWLASQDHPGDKASVSWRITAPLGVTVVATGTRTRVDTTEHGAAWSFEMREATPVHTMVVGAARLATAVLEPAACASRCVPVSVMSYPADLAWAVDGPFKRASEMIDFFGEKFGPFPYRELRHVQTSTIFGGMENSTAIFYDERGWSAHRLSEGTVAHETAHQWFGDAVSQSDWHHLWLSEGFATYAGALWAEHTRGDTGLRESMQQAASGIQQAAVRERPIIDPDATRLMSLLNANNYQKGSWVLHSLRGLVGDRAFFAGVQGYFAAHRHGNALTRDFVTAMEQATGEPLDWYFRQALTQPGYPILDVTSRAVDDGLEVRIIQLQGASWGTFRIPQLQLRVNGALHQFALDGRDVTRVLPVERPDNATVEVDPFGWWLLDVRMSGGQ